LINRYKMPEHFTVTIADNDVAVARNTAVNVEPPWTASTALRISLKPESLLDATSTFKAYKQPAHAERAFCSRLDIRRRGSGDSHSKPLKTGFFRYEMHDYRRGVKNYEPDFSALDSD
jgi:hypothetical protein